MKMDVDIASDLLEILKNAVEENIEKYYIEVENNERGQGFVGEILFVTLTHKITQTKKKAVVKQEQEGNGRATEFFSLLFSTEIKFYEIVWPFLRKYYKSVTGKDLDFIPSCFGTSRTGRKRLVLDNIKPQGYVLYDKTKPFDDEHFNIIFKIYGIYHGISMALREKDNQQYSQLVNHQANIFMTGYRDEAPLSKDFIDKVRSIQEYFDPVQEKPILEKLRLYEESGPELLRQCTSGTFPNGVILHGDCWSNNLMFKYNEQRKIQDIKLLDFQLMCHGSPIFDLSYCFYSGACEETLSKLDYYLKIYHCSLSDTLKEFGLEADVIYSLKTLKVEWKKYCKFGFPLGLMLWRMKLVDKNAIPDYTKDVESPVKVSEQLKEDYKARIRELVFHFYKNDYF